MPSCLNENVDLRKARLRWVHKLRREALRKGERKTTQGIESSVFMLRQKKHARQAEVFPCQLRTLGSKEVLNTDSLSTTKRPGLLAVYHLGLGAKHPKRQVPTYLQDVPG